MAAITPTRRRRTAGPDDARGDRPWNVVVLNDDHNTFEGVAFALARVIPGVGYDQGMRLANRIHSTGRAIVWSGHKERAELYHEQLGGYGLTMGPLRPS